MAKVVKLAKRTYLYQIHPVTKLSIAGEWHEAGTRFLVQSKREDAFGNVWMRGLIGGFLYETDSLEVR